MRTILTGIRVNDLDLAVDFYTAVGYLEVGRVRPDEDCTLVVLRLPDEDAASLELVHRPAEGPVAVGSLDHLAVQVDDLAAARADLARRGVTCGPTETPGGSDGPQIAWITDPDGHRIELVQWPAGHSVGLTEADFPDNATAGDDT